MNFSKEVKFVKLRPSNQFFFCVLLGDQITSMTVSFQQMVLEDAVTLLSYASPYEGLFFVVNSLIVLYCLLNKS